MAKPLSISDSEFEAKVLQAETPVMVDFWAPWCGPCRSVAPILDELAGEYEGKALIVKVNTDEHAQNAMKYGVRGIPTLIFFRDGQEVDRIVGAGPKSLYKGKLDELVPTEA